MSIEIDGEILEALSVGGGLSFTNGALGLAPTLPGSYSVAGALSVEGGVGAASLSAPEVWAGWGLMQGLTGAPPFSGTQGAALTWNAVPPTVAGGLWGLASDVGNAAFVNQYGGGTGGYAFWDGPDGGPWKLLATIAGAGTATPGAMTVAGGMQTKANTLDDGAGNASLNGKVTINGAGGALTINNTQDTTSLIINGNTSSGGRNQPASILLNNQASTIAGGNKFYIRADSGDYFNILNYSYGTALLTVSQSGMVRSPKNVFDDGAGNAAVAGALKPYAIGAAGYVYDVRAAGVPVDGVTDATAALNALFASGVAAEFFFPAGTTVLVGGTVTLPDQALTCRGVYGLSQIQFTGGGQFLSANANTASGVHPQHKFEGLTFVVAGSAPALEYNWGTYSQPVVVGAQEASIVFRDCGFFATTSATTAYLVSLTNIAQMLFDNCAGYATYGPNGAPSAPAQCVIGAFGSSTGGLTLANCRFNGWSRAPIVYVNGNGQTPNFQGVTLTNTTLMSDGASMGLVALDVTGLILADSYIDYCCQNVVFQGDDFYASNCWISYSPSPNNQAVTPGSGGTVTYPATNVSNLTVQGSATLEALTVELPVPAWQGVACSITFEVAVDALTVTAPSGYGVNGYPASVAAGETITFYFNVAVPSNNTWYWLAGAGPAAIMFNGPRNNFSNLHVQAYAPSVSTDPATIAFGALALGPSTLNWAGGDASVGLVAAVYEPQFNNANLIPSGGYEIVGVAGAPFQEVQAQFTMNSGGTSNGPFAISAGNALYVTDFQLPAGATQTEQTFHAPVEFEENVGVGTEIVFSASVGEGAFQNVIAQASVVGAAAFFDSISAQTAGPTIQGNAPFNFNGPVTLAGGLVRSPAVLAAPSAPVSGTWYQNTGAHEISLCIPVELQAGQSVSVYRSTTNSGGAPAFWYSAASGTTTIGVPFSVPPGQWWALSTSGTICPSGFPAGAWQN